VPERHDPDTASHLPSHPNRCGGGCGHVPAVHGKQSKFSNHAAKRERKTSCASIRRHGEKCGLNAPFPQHIDDRRNTKRP
jgi:hypothetical protein